MAESETTFTILPTDLATYHNTSNDMIKDTFEVSTYIYIECTTLFLQFQKLYLGYWISEWNVY